MALSYIGYFFCLLGVNLMTNVTKTWFFTIIILQRHARYVAAKHQYKKDTT